MEEQLSRIDWKYQYYGSMTGFIDDDPKYNIYYSDGAPCKDGWYIAKPKNADVVSNECFDDLYDAIRKCEVFQGAGEGAY